MVGPILHFWDDGILIKPAKIIMKGGMQASPALINFRQLMRGYGGQIYRQIGLPRLPLPEHPPPIYVSTYPPTKDLHLRAPP